MSALSAAVTIATPTQIAEFNVKLDTYDSAVVTALMENQVLLDAVNTRLEAMLSQAYVMADGRRVFKTEDGTQVFDQHGDEVGADELDPELIDASRPTYESYSALTDQKLTLETERAELCAFRRIRTAIPTTSGRSFRGIRTS